MNITIHFNMSINGRKADILAGGDGHASKKIVLTPGDPDFARALAVAVLGESGPVLWTSGHAMEPYGRLWDHFPTATEVLDDMDSRCAAKTAAEDQEKADCREKTLAVLTARKTCERIDCFSSNGQSIRYESVFEDWPYKYSREVIESEEAKVWAAEIAAENRQRMDAAIVRHTEFTAKKAEEDAAKAAREAEERENLGLLDGDIALEIEDGALTEVPSRMWQTHKRGKNWMAKIDIDPKSPGGLCRRFCEKARGSSYYLLPKLDPGDAIEFGADYYSGSGRPSRRRWYGFVVRTDNETLSCPGLLILRWCKDGKQAVKNGKGFAGNPADGPVIPANN